MKIVVNPHLVIHHPPTQVFAWLIDIEKWPHWGGNLVSMKQISEGSLQVGSRIRQLTKGGSKPSETIVEVTECEVGKHFGIKGSNLKGIFTLEPFEDGTRLNARFEVEATGLTALMYRLMLKQFVISDLRKFREMVEAAKVTVGR